VVFTSEPEDELWERWARGESGRLIARKLRSTPHAVRAVLARHGGVRPPTRARGKQQLTATEREEISRGIAAGLSSRAIAAALVRSPSTVSREIARNGGRRRYRAAVADAATWERARRPKASRLAASPDLLAAVRDRLERDWSPEQIAVSLKRDHPTDPGMWISHESIYRSSTSQPDVSSGPSRPSTFGLGAASGALGRRCSPTDAVCCGTWPRFGTAQRP
jgi:DNA-binding CsgD family transcriptional regulator